MKTNAWTPLCTAAMICACVVCLFGIGASAVSAFSPETTSFEVIIRDQVSPYRVLGVYVLPREELPLTAVHRTWETPFELTASAGKAVRIASNAWKWRAPEKTGCYPLTISHPRTRDTVRLNVFVLVPMLHLDDSCLNGYRIGDYPRKPYRDLPAYEPPKGLLEVTRENENTLVAPHFRLKQFLCKQEGGYPKYVVLTERLLLKLEYLLEEVNREGLRAKSFNIMSGYRTPFYNECIGNAPHSRHVYGDAADIFIDENPRNGRMDDLNGDGKADFRDALVLYRIADRLAQRLSKQDLVGGLAPYKKTASHGPFIHVDVRGHRARWGIQTAEPASPKRPSTLLSERRPTESKEQL